MKKFMKLMLTAVIGTALGYGIYCAYQNYQYQKTVDKIHDTGEALLYKLEVKERIDNVASGDRNSTGYEEHTFSSDAAKETFVELFDEGLKDYAKSKGVRYAHTPLYE